MLYIFIIHPIYQEPSIAVLPLENLTGNTDNEYLLSGMHHALIGELGRISKLRVISHESTRYYKSTKMQNTDIAVELNVRYILSGSVLSVGDSIHLILELSNARSSNQLMDSYEYHDQLAHIISMQKAVAQKVARSLRTRPSRAERLQKEQKRVINPDVYKAYLRGMYALHQGSEQWYKKGIAYMEAAIELDPGDPYAYAGLALGYATLGHGQVDSEASFARAVNAANKAIKLDPSLTEAYTALALLHLYHDWNWQLSNEAFKRALAANPNNAIAHAHYAWYHILFEDMDAAIKHAKLATYLEPLSPAYHAWLGLLYCHYANYEKAEKAARKALTLNNTSEQGNLILGWCNLHKKQFRQANTCYDRLPETPHWETMKAYCYVQSGQKEKALEIWYRFTQLEENQELNPCYMGLLAACLGFNDRAFEYLNTAIESRIFPGAYLNYFPHTKNIRKDPRYALLMQKMQLNYIPE
ncbi:MULTISPECIES: tetratricopeptide repeat protein [unclassified Carboxylicivirga]|uniref:tetratricopeptide repeat protein n=1 Tax=Carboxylicivirga TaxID=1628153 RepID=UPI003D333732